MDQFTNAPIVPVAECGQKLERDPGHVLSPEHAEQLPGDDMSGSTTRPDWANKPGDAGTPHMIGNDSSRVQTWVDWQGDPAIDIDASCNLNASEARQMAAALMTVADELDSFGATDAA